MPRKDFSQITHIWLRRPRKIDYLRGEYPFGQFICGSGVRLIILYAWPKDCVVRYGTRKPLGQAMTDLRKFGVKLDRKGKTFMSTWSRDAIRRFSIHVLYHEIGHHIDWYDRHWSKANRKETEEFAEQYAYLRTSESGQIFGDRNADAP